MKRGFTLVEMLISVALFSVVMVVALGALLALSSATRKAEALDSSVNNLSAAVDSMARTIRTGYTYHCGAAGTPGTPQDCTSSPDTYLSFTAADGSQVAYCLDANTIKRQIIPLGGGTLSSACSSSNFVPITASEVQITNLSFYVIGSQSESGGDPLHLQPKVTILMSGTVQVTPTYISEFHIETSVVQRIYDQ